MDNVTSTTVEINETENISTDRIKKRTMEMLHSEGQQTRPAKGFQSGYCCSNYCCKFVCFRISYRSHSPIPQ